MSSCYAIKCAYGWLEQSYNQFRKWTNESSLALTWGTMTEAVLFGLTNDMPEGWEVFPI